MSALIQQKEISARLAVLKFHKDIYDAMPWLNAYLSRVKKIVNMYFEEEEEKAECSNERRRQMIALVKAYLEWKEELV
ncbi:hypothetical protein L1987_20447 [Smallanthus sonchifolius]|uniref:Uncharacterized protein n=1 Tax=Smallanthus sonchifolius TaxID=185202 RepID=A0ACB9IS48_9ASTR|nr:hypothetical protein L1987_20447 [Smallanthus sonchifolius]